MKDVFGVAVKLEPHFRVITVSNLSENDISFVYMMMTFPLNITSGIIFTMAVYV